MIDLLVDVTTFLTFAGVLSYLYLIFAERRFGLPMMGSVALAAFCLAGATNQLFQGIVLFDAAKDHITYANMKDDGIYSLFWVIAMAVKALALNVVAGGALAWGEGLKRRNSQLKARETAHYSQGAIQDVRGHEQDVRGEEQDKRGRDQDQRDVDYRRDYGSQ